MFTLIVFAFMDRSGPVHKKNLVSNIYRKINIRDEAFFLPAVPPFFSGRLDKEPKLFLIFSLPAKKSWYSKAHA